MCAKTLAMVGSCAYLRTGPLARAARVILPWEKEPARCLHRVHSSRPGRRSALLHLRTCEHGGEAVGLQLRVRLKSLVPACRHVSCPRPRVSSRHTDRRPGLAEGAFVGGSWNVVAGIFSVCCHSAHLNGWFFVAALTGFKPSTMRIHRRISLILWNFQGGCWRPAVRPRLRCAISESAPMSPD